MSTSTVAKRYALALLQIAKEQKQLESMEEELRIVKEVFTNNQELLSILHSPKLTIVKKQELLRGVFASLSPYVVNTLLLLTERHREDEIAEVAEAYIQLANEERGIAEATVSSVRPLSDQEVAAISANFAGKVGKKSLRITNVVNPQLLGGIKVRIGNRIYDGSISGKLKRLEKQLAH
ncbi:MAG TPA: F0F1 ATP synthase subunit delta [Chondromyces sp.]|nr:F0F1 ATP synthase subunit delta [Chondromyces sp.]